MGIKRIKKGIVLIVLITLILGLKGYLAYGKTIDSNGIDELKSITYTVCEDVKTTNDPEIMQKIVDLINTKIAIKQEGLGGTCMPSIKLNYGTTTVTAKIAGENLIIIDNQVYKITAPSPFNASSYIAALFK